MSKIIVVSGVNLNKGGTLTILNDCLAYLSKLAADNSYRVIAIVYDKKLANYPNIEYIENKWPKKRWINRIIYEYINLNKLSKKIGPVYLWFSLHDTTPTVVAERRAVYCHSPFAFYQANFKELFFTPKIVLFSLFTKYIYKINQTKNKYIIVQQNWFKDAMKRMFNVSDETFIVAPPPPPDFDDLHKYISEDKIEKKLYSFIFASSPNSHKNFECVCKSVELLVKKGYVNFEVKITVKGDENSYAKWLYKNWGKYREQLKFIGFVDRDTLFQLYQKSDCLIFPSKIETWGLPISEYTLFNKPMLLADLPYAYETSVGANKVGFFYPNSAENLAMFMEKLILGNECFLAEQPRKMENYTNTAYNWEELFSLLLTDKK